MSQSNNDNTGRILDKLDKLDSHLDNVDKTLVRQEAQLAHHIRRTELLEEALQPIQKHVSMVEGALKFLGVLSVGVGVIVGIITIVQFLMEI
jgi:hypothetical protein